MCLIPILYYIATKSRLERELAEAVQENDTVGTPRSVSPSSDGGDPGSDSDQDNQPFSVPQISSIEMSLWSLDASATSSMDTSITADQEVRIISITLCLLPPLLKQSESYYIVLEGYQ